MTDLFPKDLIVAAHAAIPNQRDVVALGNLELAAHLLNRYCGNNRYRFTVETVYFDFGADIKWTTVICNRRGVSGVTDSYQLLNPKQWHAVTAAETFRDFADALMPVIDAFPHTNN